MFSRSYTLFLSLSDALTLASKGPQEMGTVG